MNGSNRIQILRALRAGLAIYFAAILILDTADWINLGHVVLWELAVLAFVASVIGFQAFVIRRQERLDRPRPDYSAIAAMEREVYGETFEHDGGPETAPPVAALFKPGGLITREDAGAFETLAALRRERKANCKLCDRMEREHHSNLRWERPS